MAFPPGIPADVEMPGHNVYGPGRLSRRGRLSEFTAGNLQMKRHIVYSVIIVYTIIVYIPSN